MFGYATGWLGWDPHTALHTPVPLILLALNAKAEFIRAQAGGEEKPETRSRDIGTVLDRMMEAQNGGNSRNR